MEQALKPATGQIKGAADPNQGAAMSVAQTGEQPRPEYPRPDFTRAASSWLNLNGTWEFQFDDQQAGHGQGWQNLPRLEGHINVPFAFQSSLSGIGDGDLHDHMWYACNFDLPREWAGCGQRYLLHFGAVDYACEVWVNGRQIGQHRGGHVPFSFDVSDLLKAGEPNRVVVYVEDTQNKFQPRGKQYWKRESDFCFYTRTSGIWQTVWLEAVPGTYLTRLQVQPDIDREEAFLVVEAHGRHLVEEIYWLHLDVTFQGEPVWQGELSLMHEKGGHSLKFLGKIPLPHPRLWSPETPNLYDLRIQLYQGTDRLDTVDTYFGMRKISVENGRVLLNNQPYFLKLVLDQGYFHDGLLTPPSDEAMRRDIELTKAFGFNGARKHQKIEDPRWLYWADRMGLLVWGEMPSAYDWNEEAEAPFIEEWLQVITRDYNHPCLMTWVPFNESWGIEAIARDPRLQKFVRKVVALTRDMDKTRLVVDNDGWEHLDHTGDLLTIHDYTPEGHQLFERYAQFNRRRHEAGLPLVSERPIILPEGRYRGEPVLFTEFGGMSVIPADRLAKAALGGDWGYSNATTPVRLVEQYRGLIEALSRMDFCSGFCYTQLTDVEQEVNGLLTYDRQLKVDPALFAAIHRLLDTFFDDQDQQGEMVA